MIWSADQQRQVLDYIRSFTYIPPWASAYRSGQGMIQGQVVQGTPGGPAVAHSDVVLHAFAGMDPVATFTTTLGADGKFQFEKLGVDPNINYIASAPASGATYSGPIVKLSAEQPSASTTITVYEPTNDPSGVRIERAHWIVDSQPGALLVGVIVTFGSNADHAYVGKHVDGVDMPVTAALPVPDGAQSITLDNGELGQRFRQVGNVVYDTMPVLPGTGEQPIIMRYALPYNGTDASLEQKFDYPIAHVDLLVAQIPTLKVNVSGLDSVGSQDFQGQTYQIWQGSDLQPGSVQMSFAGLLAQGETDPRAAASGSTTSNGSSSPAATSSASVAVLESATPWFSGGFVVLVLAGVVVWSWQQGRINSGKQEHDLHGQQDELLRRIAHLDDLHAIGELDMETWRTQRAQLKAKLLDVVAHLPDAAAPPSA